MEGPRDEHSVVKSMLVFRLLSLAHCSIKFAQILAFERYRATLPGTFC